MMYLSKVEKKLLHYVGKAIADYKMIQTGDRVLIGLSGGKDSFGLLNILRLLAIRTHHKFSIHALTLHQGQPNFDTAPIADWLNAHDVSHEILHENTFKIVEPRIAPGKNYCSFCARLRRGIIYRYAKENGFTKIALGHHRDDLIESLLMSVMYSGEIRSMPPKLLTQDKRHILIRPLALSQEKDLEAYAKEQGFPVSVCVCGGPKPKTRANIKALIKSLAKENPKVPSNMLHALQNVKVSQLMDHNLWSYKTLEEELIDA